MYSTRHAHPNTYLCSTVLETCTLTQYVLHTNVHSTTQYVLYTIVHSFHFKYRTVLKQIHTCTLACKVQFFSHMCMHLHSREHAKRNKMRHLQQKIRQKFIMSRDTSFIQRQRHFQTITLKQVEEKCSADLCSGQLNTPVFVLFLFFCDLENGSRLLKLLHINVKSSTKFVTQFSFTQPLRKHEE